MQRGAIAFVAVAAFIGFRVYMATRMPSKQEAINQMYEEAQNEVKGMQNTPTYKSVEVIKEPDGLTYKYVYAVEPNSVTEAQVAEGKEEIRKLLIGNVGRSKAKKLFGLGISLTFLYCRPDGKEHFKFVITQNDF